MTSASMPLPNLDGNVVEGVFSIVRITYLNEENGYAVVQLVPADHPESAEITAVGLFGEPRVGACLRVRGTWKQDRKYGWQVRVDAATPETPRSLPAIERYLAGASIKGLGPYYAHKLVSHFREQTFEELQRGGQRLEEVSGIGPVRAALIRESWAEHRGIHDLMVNLQGVAGLSPNQANRIYHRFGQEAWETISRDPYVLAEEVRGFGFITCDRIGRALGIAHDAPERIRAGILHLLKEALVAGHLWTSTQDVAEGGAELLGVSSDAVRREIGHLIARGTLVAEELSDAEGRRKALYLPRIVQAEQRIAERLAFLLTCSVHPKRAKRTETGQLASPAVPQLCLERSQALALLRRQGQQSLTEEQCDAIVALLGGARVTILTGGPGTGKTTTLRSLIACLEALQVPYALCATTGRAAKQLAAMTDRPAATVHRHLGLGSTREVEVVHETVLIIDEASMIDLWLFDDLLARLSERTHLFLVGDVDQLPPVGPGAVLQDLIAAAEQSRLHGLHVTRLGRIFRQEAGEESYIVTNCHRVRAGQRPIRVVPPTSDYFEIFRETPTEARELAVELVAERLPRYLQVPPDEVQVLAPMHNGEAGIRALNEALQVALNPPTTTKAELVIAGGAQGAHAQRVFRVGDKVRQTRNDYQKGVFNGDLGTIVRVFPEERGLVVRFDEQQVGYTADELEDLVHAWAMTVHAAQGSQWPAVVVIMLKSHYVMLERNILYTALSRAQRLAVLITQDAAVRVAVAQDRSTRRRTGLVARLMAQTIQPDGGM